jgi:hypothetical protein
MENKNGFSQNKKKKSLRKKTTRDGQYELQLFFA